VNTPPSYNACRVGIISFVLNFILVFLMVVTSSVRVSFLVDGRFFFFGASPGCLQEVFFLIKRHDLCEMDETPFFFFTDVVLRLPFCLQPHRGPGTGTGYLPLTGVVHDR